MDEPARAFRRALSGYATGVAVISATRPRGDQGGEMCGITVNSFASVSLEPPLVLWCLGDKSERRDVFEAAETWGVTILRAGEEALARRYAKPESEVLAPHEAEDFAGAPVLKAGIIHFACRTHERRPAGDHLIIIGEVAAHRVLAGDALTFFRGRYGAAPDQENT